MVFRATIIAFGDFMLIKREGGKSLVIRSVDNTWQTVIPLDQDPRWTDIALSPDSRYLAVAGPNSGQLTPLKKTDMRPLVMVDLKTSKVTVIRKRASFEPQWFPTGTRVAYSNGSAICSIDAAGKNDIEHIQVSRVLRGPQSIFVSPDERYICGFKWKGDKNNLAAAELDGTIVESDLPVPRLSFSWFNEDKIAYDTLKSGIKLCDVSTGKTSAYLPDLNVPQLRTGQSTHSPEVSMIMQATSASGYQRVDYPSLINSRVYFRVHTYDRTHQYYAVLSVKADRSDLRCDYLVVSKIEHPYVIESYVVLSQGKMVAVEVVDYVNARRLGAEWRYSDQGGTQYETYPGYHPLPNTPVLKRGGYVPW
jgi:hypothetical protein